MAKIVDIGYRPRPLQQKIHKELKRFNVLIIHRRAGKTHLSIMEILDKGLRCEKKNPQYAYISPTFKQSKRVAWEILKGYANKIPGFEANESELRVDIPRPQYGDRLRIYLLGAEDPGSLRGLYLDGVVLDEYAEMGPDLWATVIRPALSDRIGWAIFIGTPRGTNHFYDIYQTGLKNPSDWYTAIHKASSTGIIPIGELEANKAIMSEEEYAQEFECSFSAALIGAYYGKEMELCEKEGRITNVPHESGEPVDTYWDLGIGDSTAIWFVQQIGREYRLIDYLEDSGRDLPHYGRELQKKKYLYGEIVLPHDAAARDLSTGKSREEVLRNMGFRTRVLPRHSFDDGKDAARRILAQCWFDAVRCERGINCLKNYEKKWDAKNKIFSSAPLHNWASHGADAFRAFAMGSIDGAHRVKWQDLPRHVNNAYDVFAKRR